MLRNTVWLSLFDKTATKTGKKFFFFLLLRTRKLPSFNRFMKASAVINFSKDRVDFMILSHDQMKTLPLSFSDGLFWKAEWICLKQKSI